MFSFRKTQVFEGAAGSAGDSKSVPRDSKSSQNRSQEASWRGLGRSWAQDGPKRAPTANMYKKPKPFHPPFGRQNPPKIDPKSIPKAIKFCNDFLIDFFMDFGSQKSIKNRSKIDPKIYHLFGKFNISELFNPPIFSSLSRKVDSLFCCAFLVRFLQIIFHPFLSLIFERF